MMLKKKLEFFVFLILLGVQVLSAQDVSDSDVSLPENVAYEEVVDKENDVRHIHIKTNVVGWGLLVANLAGEIDLDRHWSFALPLYYSGIDYFSSRTKFRTFTVQPEIRYWFDANHSGWFVGAHLGLSCFNIAWGGEYRYQGYDRNTPALGGGVGGGYRMPITQNRRWWMEFSLGGGVYALKYDKFRNDPNGQLLQSRKGTFFGVDHAAVSFSYRFDLKK